MALSSMTGFARVACASAGAQWSWEIKTVNGRSLDVRARLPAGFESLDGRLKSVIGKHLARGNCQLSLTLKRDRPDSALRLNDEALAQVLNAIKSISGKIETSLPAAENILTLRGVFESAEAQPDEDEQTRLESLLLESLDEVSATLASARKAEGAQLEAILVNQIERLENLVDQTKTLEVTRPEFLRTRLKSQLDTLLETRPGLPEDRLAQELAVLLTKSDVREELDRLKAHLASARALLAKNEPIGRQLDFLSQELNREANTLCSKSTDVALTRIGVELKTVIDQFREQVQNVE